MSGWAGGKNEKRSVWYVVVVEVKVDKELIKILTRIADSLGAYKKSEDVSTPQEKNKDSISLPLETQNLSIVELRELMAVKKKEGKAILIKDLLDKYSSPNLTTLDESVYAEFYKDLEVL
jgi:hypothetical protein